MPTRNYVVVSNDMTLTDKKDYRVSAIAAGLERCAIKSIGDLNSDIPGLQAIAEADKRRRVQLIKEYIATGKWPKSIDQRELHPGAAGDLVVATALDSWLTAALAVVGNFYSCFQAVAGPQLIQNKLLVCYGISIDSAAVPLPVSRLIFRRGGAIGNIQAEFDLEPMQTRQEVDAFFSEPVVIDPQAIFAIQVRCRNATGAAEIVHIHNFLFEVAGEVIA